jgi:hypothetical protein
MDFEFVDCGAHQSGQRFPDSSVPRLRRHAASREAAGGGHEPPPAGKDQKLPWGFGGDAPDERAVGASFYSLDEVENNRHNPRIPEYYRRPLGRGKFCGRCCIRGIDPNTGRTVYRRLNCGSWTCAYCGPRRARTARRRICEVAEALNLRYFLTLTLDPKKLEHPKLAVPHLRLCFNKFREYLKREFGEAPSYVCVLEFTQAGVPHLHVLLDRYIHQRWISKVWDSLGGGRIVFIKQVTVRRVARYLSKYLTKELIMSAPKGTRRITTARSIKLFPKFNSGIAWELLRSSIWQMLSEVQTRQWGIQRNLYEFISIDLDEEHYLKAFQLHNLWSDRGMEQGACELLATCLPAS